MSKSVPLLLLMVIFCPLAVDIYLPGIPAIVEEFSVRAEKVQWSIGIFLFSIGVGQLFFGPLSDHFGRRPIAIAGGLIYILASLMAVMSVEIEWFLLSRVFQGIGACAMMVVAFAFVRDRYSVTRSGMIFSYLNGAVCCVPALAPILGNVLLEWFGWRSHFWFLTGYGLIAWILISVYLPETRPQQTAEVKIKGMMASYLDILQHPRFIFHSLVVLLSMSVIIAYVTHAPVWIIMELGYSGQDFIFWFSLNGALNILAYLITPQLLERFGSKRLTEWGVLLVCVSGILMLTLLSNRTPLGFMAPVFLSSTGIALTMGASSGQALSPFANKAATASALLGFMQMCGSAVMVFLVQQLPLTQMEQLAALMLLFVLMYVQLKVSRQRKLLFGH